VRLTAGGLTQTRVVRSGGSYLADHDRRIVFSLGGERQAKAEIHWPCGGVQTVTAAAGTMMEVREAACRQLRAREQGERVGRVQRPPGSL